MRLCLIMNATIDLFMEFVKHINEIALNFVILNLREPLEVLRKQMGCPDS